MDDIVSNEQLRQLVPHHNIFKDGSETLREHVQHQIKNGRNEAAPTSSWIPSSEYQFAQTYDRERDYQPFISYMRLWLRTSTKPKEGTRNFARLIQKCIEEDRPFFHGFFADEPSWRPRLLKWAERVLRPSTKKH